MLDRNGKRQAWAEASRAERWYSARLRQVARQVGAIITGFAPNGVLTDDHPVIRALTAYSELLGPWAHAVSAHMIADVSRRNLRTWKSAGVDISRAIRTEIQQAPTGQLFRDLQAEQVVLIKSLPTQAGARVHLLTQEALLSSTRAAEVAKEIARSGEVTAARATLIARTEVARTASNLTQARAVFAGSEGYIWRSSDDGDVRPTHATMNGKYVRWDTPPKTDKNLDPYHAGCGPNCRCYPEPVLPDL